MKGVEERIDRSKANSNTKVFLAGLSERITGVVAPLNQKEKLEWHKISPGIYYLLLHVLILLMI